MRRHALALAIIALGCQPQPQPVSGVPCQPVFLRPSEELAAPLAYVGKPVELKFFWESGQKCSEGTRPRVDSVGIELIDPDNLQIPAVAGLPVYRLSSNGDRWDVTVGVALQRLGSHHVILTFNPGGGLVQGDILAVEDRRTDQVAETAVIPNTPCSRLERLGTGGRLCQQPAGGTKLFRGQTEVGWWPLGIGRSAGSAFWVTQVGGNGVGRFTETADGGVEGQQLATNSSAFFTALPDAAVMWLGEDTVKVSHDAGQLTLGPRQSTVGLYVTALAYSPETDGLVVGTINRWGRFVLSAPSQFDTTTMLPGTSSFQARDGVWFDNSDSTMVFVPADLRQPLRNISLPQGWRPISARAVKELQPGDRPLIFPLRRLPTSSDSFPALDRTEVLVPVQRPEGDALAHFVAPQGAKFEEVSGGFLRATAGEQHYFFQLDP